MSFTHMGAVAGMASPDSSSSQMYRRGVLIHCPPEYSVDIVPPVKEGSSWHYGLRVKPLAGLGSPIDGPGDAKARRIKGYEIHRKWEDCLDLQRLLEKEYAAVAKARKGGKKIYGGRPERAASFDSLPTGPDPKTIPTDIHAFIPRLAAKSSLFRGASGSALVQQRSEEFNEFISALFAPGVPVLVDEVRQTPSVREWFGFWRRDRDSMRRRDGDRASIAPSTRRLSIASDAPPLPPNSTSPFTSSPLAQTSYESSPISSTQEEPRQSCDTTYGDLASALDTFPMPPTPLDGPVALEPSPKAASQPMPSTGFVPIVQRRLGLVRNDAARNAAFRNAQFFSHPPTSPLPPLPKSVPASDCEYESDRARRPDGRPRRATSPTLSSASHLSQPTRSASPRSSRTSDWSMSAMAQALGLSIDEPEPISPVPAPTPADEQSEIEYARKASLSSLSSTSSKRPPPIPPRSSLRRSQSSGAHVQKQERPIPTVVYDEHEPEFEITHSVINSYFEDNRASMLSSALSSNSGSSVRRSMTPSIASAYSTTSSVGSVGVPSTPLTAIPAHEIVLKAACPVGDSIVIARIPRALPLEAVRSVLATKFRQAAGVQLDVLEHGFVLGYLSAPRPTRPGTGGRPVTPARSSARPPAGRTRSSSLSSMAACADPTHLTLIVTQRDWENAVAKHGEKMTVRVLLAGSD